MSRYQSLGIAVSAAILLACLASRHDSAAEPVPAAPANEQAEGTNRFEFDVIESFNAKYQGDTPGHTGRGGKIEGQRPNIALGDHVYRGKQKIGDVTSVAWDRARGSLDIEFDAHSGTRVAVGDSVWVYFDGTKAKPPVE